MERGEIAAVLDEWVREVVIDPRTGVPFVDGGLDIAGYNTFLIGHMPDADPPKGGTRSHLLNLWFLLTPNEDKRTIGAMVEQLKAAALADPTLAGRLPRAHRLELGAAKTVAKDSSNKRGGPVVVLQAVIAEFDPGKGDAEAAK